jgi:hypothetical protein
MPVLRIEHAVSDYDSWKRAFYVRNPQARIVDTLERVQL